jgi:hypothetical protein
MYNKKNKRAKCTVSFSIHVQHTTRTPVTIPAKSNYNTTFLFIFKYASLTAALLLHVVITSQLKTPRFEYRYALAMSC